MGDPAEEFQLLVPQPALELLDFGIGGAKEAGYFSRPLFERRDGFLKGTIDVDKAELPAARVLKRGAHRTELRILAACQLTSSVRSCHANLGDVAPQLGGDLGVGHGRLGAWEWVGGFADRHQLGSFEAASGFEARQHLAHMDTEVVQDAARQLEPDLWSPITATKGTSRRPL